METSLMGLFVIVAFMVPVMVYALFLLLMGTHAASGRYGTATEQYFDSPYQPMRILMARHGQGEAPPVESPAAPVTDETRVAA